MAFASDVDRWKQLVRNRARAVRMTAVFLTHESITVGSAITGAPGQPVQYGALRQSFQIEVLSPTMDRIASAKKYARSIEDLLSYAHGGTPLTIRSKVGGGHSIKMTVAAWTRIVEEANRRVAQSPAFDVGEPPPELSVTSA